MNFEDGIIAMINEATLLEQNDFWPRPNILFVDRAQSRQLIQMTLLSVIFALDHQISKKTQLMWSSKEIIANPSLISEYHWVWPVGESARLFSSSTTNVIQRCAAKTGWIHKSVELCIALQPLAPLGARCHTSAGRPRPYRVPVWPIWGPRVTYRQIWTLTFAWP